MGRRPGHPEHAPRTRRPGIEAQPRRGPAHPRASRSPHAAHELPVVRHARSSRAATSRSTQDRWRTLLYCGDRRQCEFSEGGTGRRRDGLPVVARRRGDLPAASDADDRHGRQVRADAVARAELHTLFGTASTQCDAARLPLAGPRQVGDPGAQATRGRPRCRSKPSRVPLRPPDLIIQDELHLISGPLGTLVGLYETAVDELCSLGARRRARSGPKVIASTATVRRAAAAGRRAVHAGVLESSRRRGWTSRTTSSPGQRAIDRASPGRRYIGICAPGSGSVGRADPGLRRRARPRRRSSFDDLRRPVADPYMTLVGYFNALRELGGMRRLVEDDVQTRLLPRRRYAGCARRQRRSYARGADLAGMPAQDDIRPHRSTGSTVALRQQPGRRATPRPIDVRARDQHDLRRRRRRTGSALMVVVGQPKATAEYIQATSRVGRAHARAWWSPSTTGPGRATSRTTRPSSTTTPPSTGTSRRCRSRRSRASRSTAG